MWMVEIKKLSKGIKLRSRSLNISFTFRLQSFVAGTALNIMQSFICSGTAPRRVYDAS